MPVPATGASPRPLNRRRWLAAIALIAVAAAVLATYRVSLSPPGLHPREVQFAVAKAEVLIDTPISQLGDRRQDPQLGMIAHLAEPDALLLKTDMARAVAAAAAGARGRLISVDGPFNLLLNQTNRASKGPTITDPLPVAANDRLLVDIDGHHPMITLWGQAPTTRAAVAIVDSVRALLRTAVAQRERAYPLAPQFRAVVRPLGPTTSSVVDPGARLQVIGLVIGLVLAAGISLMLAVERARRRRAAGKTGAALGEPAEEPMGEGTPDDDEWPHTRRPLPWALAAFLVMVFLVPIDAISLPIHLPLNSKPDRVLLVVIAGLWLAALFTKRGIARPRLALTGVHVAVLVFVAICLASVAFNGHELAVNQEVSPVFKKLLLLISFVGFFVIAASVLRPREVPRFINLMIGLGVIVAIATIIERTTKYDIFYGLWGKITSVTPPPELDKLDGIGRLSVDGPTAEPLELAALLAIVLPFAVVGAVTARTWARRALAFAAVAILLGGALATGRKTGILAPVVGLVVLIAYRPRPMLKGLAIAAVPLFLCVHLMAPGQIGTTFNELLPGHADSALTTKDRVARYDAVRPDLLSHPLIGSGFQGYDPVKNRILDNEFLGLAIEVGGIGLAGYIAIFLVLLGAGHAMIRGPDPRRSDAALATQAALVTVAIANALFDELSFTHVSYLFFFTAAMVVALRSPARAPATVPVRSPAPPSSSPPDPEREPWPELEPQPQPEPAVLV